MRCEQCFIFEFVGELVEAAKVEAWSKSGFMSDQAIRLSSTLWSCQRTSQSVINDLLHRPSLPVHRIFDQAGNVRIQRQSRSHACIIVLRSLDIKMQKAAASRCVTNSGPASRGTGLAKLR
jgi:hypothetical protein